MEVNLKYCKKCVMPDTRPGIKFDSEGVCSACRTFENRKNVNWDERYKELVYLCDKYRGMNGDFYDCAIAVSGGKDSHYQVHVMKELMHMNPILLSVEDNFTMTEAGKHNIKNISEEFGCNIISLKPDIKTQKLLMRYCFEKYGKPTWFIDRMIYTFPILMSLKLNTPLLVYGENVSYEYGGSDAKETYSARDILSNGVATDIPYEELCNIDGVDKGSLQFTKSLSADDINKIDPIYISYFLPWNSVENYKYAKSRGFKDLEGEWNRSQCIENYDQIDSYAYLVHAWLKYPKFGHAQATDYASRLIRYGLLSRDEAIKLVNEHDEYLDEKCIEDFCKFTGYSFDEFYKIINKFYNKDIFEFKNNKYELKNKL